MAAVARRLRPAGWLVFDLHTDAMMDFTIANPVVAGESAGNGFVISSVVDPAARTCDTTIELTRPRDGDPFSEQHRQYFHADADVRAALQDAGFAVTAVGEEYTHEPVDASTLRRPGRHGACRPDRLRRAGGRARGRWTRRTRTRRARAHVQVEPRRTTIVTSFTVRPVGGVCETT